MNKPTIRLLSADDLAAYKTLRDAGLKSDPEAFNSDFDAETQRPPASYATRLGEPPHDDFILGAFDADGNLLGAVVCMREAKIKKRHEASLAGMIVDPAHRNQGIGRTLLAEVDTLIRRMPGVEHIVLTVTTNNANAVRLYEGAGFVHYGLLPRALKIDDQYFDQALMVKKL